ncbi:MAG: DUF296 domain-containing protein [Firmicutes bacterium]|nr:DUF296 domain-containing protein [Bacillota bacterium]
MKYYEGASPGRTIVLRFDKGDYIIEGIRQVLREAEIKNGYIASGIGSFDNCRLKIPLTTELPPKFTYPEFNDTPLEVVAVQGFIADGQPHIHVVVSDHKKCLAGHLEEARILYVGEIVIQELVGLDFTREATGPYLERIVLKEEE